MNGEIKWCKRGIVFDDDGKKYMAVVYNNRTTEKVAYEPGKIIINNSGMTLSGIIEANEIINSFISEDISSDESNTIVFAVPLEVLRALEKISGK